MNKSACLQRIRERSRSSAVEPPPDAEARLRPLENIRAVVFDVYGTLFSSGVGDISLAAEADRNQALRDTLADSSIRTTDTRSRLDQAFTGIVRKQQAARRQEGIEFPEVEIRDVWKEFLQTLPGAPNAGRLPDLEDLAVDYETRVNPTRPMPGLEAVLTELRGRGIKMGIVSNAQFFTPLLFEAFLEMDLAALGLDPECCVWSYRLLEAKPSLRLYREAADRLATGYGIEPGESLYVGNDLRNDIWPASELGYQTALFAGDRLSLRRRTDDPDCAGVRADLEITNLGQVLECLL